MGRTRKKSKHLPERVYQRKPGAPFYFVDRAGKWHRLGTDYAEAMLEYAKLMRTGATRTLSQVIDSYIKNVLPNKAPRTQVDNLREIALLRPAFGHFMPDQVTPVDVYAYMDRRPPTRANREKALLSHIYSHAIRLGAASGNPCRLVKNNPETKRQRYVTDTEFADVRALAAAPVRLAMDLAYITGLRKGDLFALTWAQVQADGIHVATGKTGKRLLIEWSDELGLAVERCKALPSKIQSLYVLHNRDGQPYSESGFNSVWLRLQRKYAKAGGRRFRWHDIRRKAATDGEQDHGREFVRRLLAHDDQKTTGRYVAGELRVRPIR